MSKKKRLRETITAQRQLLFTQRQKIKSLEKQLATTPSLYFAALAGIVQGQKHPLAGPDERAERAASIERFLGSLVSYPGTGEPPVIRLMRENYENGGLDVER